MTRHPTLPALKGLLLVLGCVLGSAGAWRLARLPLLTLGRPLLTDGPSALAALELGDVVAGGCAAALLGCVGWVLATTALVALTSLARLASPRSPVLAGLSRLAERACPTLARGLVTAVLGLAVGTAVTAPAWADPSGGTVGRSPSAGLTGLALPDRATGQVPATTAPRTAPGPDDVVVVRRGDSLWSIAAGLLPAGADDARIDLAWHRLHHANRSRIGDDPDLIRPGTRLVVPEPLAPDGEERP